MKFKLNMDNHKINVFWGVGRLFFLRPSAAPRWVALEHQRPASMPGSSAKHGEEFTTF